MFDMTWTLRNLKGHAFKNGEMTGSLKRTVTFQIKSPSQKSNLVLPVSPVHRASPSP